MIKWINGSEPKTFSVNGKKTAIGYWNLYLEGTTHFVTLSPEQIKQYIPYLGNRQRYCYGELLDVEIEHLYGGMSKEEIA
ncbi:hypothetical protein [Peribacillus sp. TH14]|uniref:hypothetical protein n=1 Tax=Peribacillus sp. TH14 TaxID=2798481 RepID=UPI001912BF5E|nr:hypothetical protein [Peribacillus sp. TH14]MBK5500922.1 hypothetical protein [Peribacillus sp. TH14]